MTAANEVDSTRKERCGEVLSDSARDFKRGTRETRPMSAPDPNRVVIDDCAYEVKSAGTQRYAVFDEFGAAAGYFSIRGLTVVPDDFGVATHPVLRIGRVWQQQNGDGIAAERKACWMVARTESVVGPLAELQNRALARVSWLKTEGLAKLAYASYEAETSTLTITAVFATKQRLEASEAKPPPENCGPLEGATARIAALLQDA